MGPGQRSDIRRLGEGTEEWDWVNTKDCFNKSATYHDDDNLDPTDLAKIGNQGGPLHISHSDLIPGSNPSVMLFKSLGSVRAKN
jgi:hypothetical protein